VCTFENEIIYRDSEPVAEYFPAQWAPVQIPRDKAGTTAIDYITPVGKLSIAYEVAESMVAMGGVEPYLTHHLIKAEEDYRTAEYIIEHAEIILQIDKIGEDQCELGDNGFVVPCLHRIPFQQALLEYLVPLFTALYDSPQQLNRLLHLLDLQLMEILRQMADLSSVYVESGDNLDGTMTNPNLFKRYSLPYYQKYADILHGQGKKVSSHTDGNVKPLLSLLTECTFQEAWETWQNGPLVWGGVPSPILEERTSETEFQDYIHCLLEIIGNRNIILGVGDMVLGNNLIERVEYIAKEVEHHQLV
jgi:hypothetical protein